MLRQPMLIASALVMVLAISAACSPAIARSPLAGTQWRLIELDGRAPIPTGEPLTLRFDEGDQAGGNSGCNIYGGSYRATSTALTFGALASTQRACLEPALNDQEMAFYQALGAVVSYELVGGQLVLTDAAGAARLRFARV
ncbi:MAG: META domain-containing protein [Chloroflexi bacterium]|nr:META domain-containing protein [Chloroflexota bacterium]